jgi:SNF2 family DNA or RNA helicase
MSNIILEQYGVTKKQALKASPFSCFDESDVETQPHQIDAFVRAIKSLDTGGLVLADEVGLGKTIEAGLTLKYLIKSGAKKIVIAVPATLRKQWQIELDEKFDIKSEVVDRQSLMSETTRYVIKDHIQDKNHVFVAITTYYFASQLIKRADKTAWDFVIIDEAHNLRNAFRGAQRAKKLFDATKNIPKLLLTATPIQNNIDDLYSLISFIDPKIFGDEKIFNAYAANNVYEPIKDALKPVVQRTLRRDVGKYLQFKKRTSKTFDFCLSKDEKILYSLVDKYLKRDISYGFPNASNRNLLLLVVRKMLASSSKALIETFEVIKTRLVKLKQGTKSINAQQGFDSFLSYLDDEEEETGVLETKEDDSLKYRRNAIEEEIGIVNEIITLAEKIQVNAKMEKLLEAVEYAFEHQRNNHLPEKAVIFTESKRTQRYIRQTLIDWGFRDDEIVIFNGDMTDEKSKRIYNNWRALNYNKKNYGQQIEFRHAMVDYFKKKGKVFISTDAGSEGLNLQFCNIIINYDLPWNPMKIEQRIGRCHRYGQQHDVLAINFLNTENEADKRVYEILSKKFELFEGIFGASDKALEILENGSNFEKEIFDIYQTTNTSMEVKRKFDALDRSLEKKRNKVANTLRTLLETKTSDEKNETFDKAYTSIVDYLDEVAYWDRIDKPEKILTGISFKLKKNPFMSYGINSGFILFGGLIVGNSLEKSLAILTDDSGSSIGLTEKEIINCINSLDNSEIENFIPRDNEMKLIGNVISKAEDSAAYDFERESVDIIEYNKKKMENWVSIQESLLQMDLTAKSNEIEAMKTTLSQMTNFLEKVDYRERIEKKQHALEREQNKYYQSLDEIKKTAQKAIADFNSKYYKKCSLLVRIVVKF